MRTKTHLRPREKIAERAVHALSENELLQAIIGSGSARFPVNYIARRIQNLLKDGVPSIQTLRQVSGVGEALASRLVAVFELGSRLSANSTQFYRPKVVTPACVEVVFFDAQRSQLAIDLFDRTESSGLLLQRICKRVLIVAASRVSVAIRYDTTPELSVLDDLCFVRELYAALSLFDVTIDGVHRQWGSYRKELT